VALVAAEHPCFLHPVRMPVGIQRLSFIHHRPSNGDSRVVARRDQAADVRQASGRDLQVVPALITDELPDC